MRATRATRGGSTPAASGGDLPAADHTARTMRAIVQTGYGAPQQVLRLAEVPVPAVGAEDVLVQVRASSVNTPDWIVVAGVPRILRLQSGLRRPAHPVRGSDVAGVVQAVGADVTDLKPGDEVFGSTWDNKSTQEHGTFAQLVAVPAAQVRRKPDGISFEEAAAAVMSGLTALIAIRDVAGAGPGTRVLINGASGGVGTFAVQIAKGLGAHVTGVCSTDNIELVRSLGADEVIDYTQVDFTKADFTNADHTNADRAEGQDRYDVILDNVMNHPPSATARALAPGGVLIPNSVGNSGGLFAGLPRMARAALMGRLSGTRVQFMRCVVDRAHLEALAGLLASGDVRAVIDRTFDLRETADAVGHMLSHRARGNVAITVA